MAGAIAVLSDDPALILACGSVLALAVGLLWVNGEPPVLLMAVGLQLSQVVIRPLYASLTEIPIDAVSLLRVGGVTSAIWFALAGMLSLVVGMWCGQLGAKPYAAVLQQEGRRWSVRNAFIFFLATLLLSTVFTFIGFLAEGLRQPGLAASRIEWVGVFVVAYVSAVHRRGRYILFILCFEVLKGYSNSY
jgi:hypothetical protein